jgi:aldose sugar dehydrogenase
VGGIPAGQGLADTGSDNVGHRAVAVAVSAMLLAAGCWSGGDGGGGDGGETGRLPSASTSPTESGAPARGTARVTGTAATGLRTPWGVAVLPDGDLLIASRDTGAIVRVAPDTGRQTPVGTVPGVAAGGEGGLLGLAVSPEFATDRQVYAYFTTESDNRIARMRYDESQPEGERLGAPDTLLRDIPHGAVHNGGRIAFGPDGMVYAGTGESGERGLSQDRESLGGKILRMTPDGEPAPGNPFPGSPVYSYGHRNVQGLAWDDAGRMFASELGQNRRDEVNRIEKGANYGWPEVEGTGGGKRFRDPLVTWPTSQASPSGAAIAGDTLFVAALRGERLWKVPLDGTGGTGEPAAVLAGAYGRLRHVAVASDGALWVLTSNRDGRGDPAPDDDRILRFPRA